MTATQKRLDIDRWMYWIICDACGGAFWHCERQPRAKCPGCKRVEEFGPVKTEFEKLEGK